MSDYEPYDQYMSRMYKEHEPLSLSPLLPLRGGWKNESTTRWHNRFIEMAKMVSTWSKDPSSQIGAVAINDERRILATGYNGFPKGIADTEERLNDRDQNYPRIIHAEMNALMNALYSGVSLKDATLYVYGLPVCPSCTKCIIQAGIKHVVIPSVNTDKGNWQEVWEEQSLPMFKESGVQVTILGL
jgi:dCMP deaminase